MLFRVGNNVDHPSLWEATQNILISFTSPAINFENLILGFAVLAKIEEGCLSFVAAAKYEHAIIFLLLQLTL